MDTQQPPLFTSAPPPPSPGVFGTRIPSTVSFIVGILLFLLPFAQVKCNGTALAQNTGIGIALGNEWKSIAGDTNLFGNDEPGESNANKELEKKQDPNLYAIVALGLAALGLLLALASGKAAGFGGLVAGLLSAAALIGLMIDLKNNSQLKGTGPAQKPGNFGLDTLGSMKLTVDFTPWFYIALIAFLAAAFFCYKRMQASKA